jgi:hypothetical protein
MIGRSEERERDFTAGVASDDDVLGLDVAMDEIERVDVDKRLEDLYKLK